MDIGFKIAVKYTLRFFEDKSFVGGTFLKTINQYTEKNCNSEIPILSLMLEYSIHSVKDDIYEVSLQNGTFSITNQTYCSQLNPWEIYDIRYYNGFHWIVGIISVVAFHKWDHSIWFQFSRV